MCAKRRSPPGRRAARCCSRKSATSSPPAPRPNPSVGASLRAAMTPRSSAAPLVSVNALVVSGELQRHDESIEARDRLLDGGKPLAAENMPRPSQGAADRVGGWKETGIVRRGPIGFVKNAVDRLVNEVANVANLLISGYGPRV